MSDYRFMLNADGTITRGKLYRLPSEWTSDSWSNYWDGNETAAFVVNYGSRLDIDIVEGTNSERGMRAAEAFRAERGNMLGSYRALDRLAKRLTGNRDAAFICVGLDRGTDLYALTYDGDPDRSFCDEIEAVWNGDIWRIECEEFAPGVGWINDWMPSDEYPEEFYGEDKATAEFERVFNLAEFPAEQFVGGE